MDIQEMACLNSFFGRGGGIWGGWGGGHGALLRALHPAFPKRQSIEPCVLASTAACLNSLKFLRYTKPPSSHNNSSVQMLSYLDLF